MRKERQGRDRQGPATGQIASQVWAEPWEEGRRSGPSPRGWAGEDWLQICIRDFNPEQLWASHQAEEACAGTWGRQA